MATEYIIFIGEHKIDTLTISTSRSSEDFAPIHDFIASLTPEERQIFSFVDEYQLEESHDLDDLEEIDDSSDMEDMHECYYCEEPEYSELESILIEKYEKMFFEEE